MVAVLSRRAVAMVRRSSSRACDPAIAIGDAVDAGLLAGPAHPALHPSLVRYMTIRREIGDCDLAAIADMSRGQFISTSSRKPLPSRLSPT